MRPEDENVLLKAENAALREQVMVQAVRVHELEPQLAEDRHSSSKPPSTDRTGFPEDMDAHCNCISYSQAADPQGSESAQDHPGVSARSASISDAAHSGVWRSEPVAAVCLARLPCQSPRVRQAYSAGESPQLQQRPHPI